MIFWVLLTSLFLSMVLLGGYLTFGSRFIVTAPNFRYEVLSYVYALVTIALLYLSIKLEMKLYYGIFPVIIPDGIIEIIILAGFQTIHWISFALVFFTSV